MTWPYSRARGAVANVNVPVVVVGSNYSVSYANSAAHRLLRYPAGTLRGVSLERLAPPARHSELYAFHGIFEGKLGGRMRSQATRADGSVLDVSLTIEPLTNAAGQVLAIILSYQPLPPWKANAPELPGESVLTRVM